jgi:hypothetical protein
MVFWLGTAAAAISLLISFALPQRTLRIRLVLLAFGFIGLGTTAYRYFRDQQQRAAIERKLAPRALTDQQAEEIASDKALFWPEIPNDNVSKMC